MKGFSGATCVSSVDELIETLNRRFDGANELWLSHDGAKHPALAILVQGGLACVHYFPSENHPGFLSQGAMTELSPSGVTVFFIGGTGQEPTEMPNTTVVRFSDALDAAKEFFLSEARPVSLKWLEL